MVEGSRKQGSPFCLIFEKMGSAIPFLHAIWKESRITSFLTQFIFSLPWLAIVGGKKQVTYQLKPFYSEFLAKMWICKIIQMVFFFPLKRYCSVNFEKF